MKISRSVLSGVPLIRLDGEVDHKGGAELQSAVQEALASGARQILIDLESCAYLDSAGLSILLRLAEEFRGRGWVGTIAPSRMALRLFDLVGLTEEPDFRIFPSMSDARSVLRDRDRLPAEE
jgi:anti-anti-sigma factor